MLPALGQLEAAFEFLNRRHARTTPFPAVAMTNALEDARALVQTIETNQPPSTPSACDRVHSVPCGPSGQIWWR
jgi:hypothetical protein